MLPNTAALPLQAAQPLSSTEPPERTRPLEDERELRHRAAGALRTLSTSEPTETSASNPYIATAGDVSTSTEASARNPYIATAGDVSTSADAAAARAAQEAPVVESAPPLSWRACARLGTSGLALAALFGAAGGARYGLRSAVLHGLGAPLAFAAVTLVVVPSLYVAFAYVDVVITPREVGSVCARAVLSAGTLLAGLAPALLMLAVSVESDISAGAVTWLGLLSAGSLGLRRVVSGLDHAAHDEEIAPTVARRLLLTGFIVVASVTALRIWWLAMPMLGGGR